MYIHVHVHPFAPWDSNLKTKKSASGKRPPDEAHGSGDETIRLQRSSEAGRSSEKKVHSSEFKSSAKFVKRVQVFEILFSKLIVADFFLQLLSKTHQI